MEGKFLAARQDVPDPEAVSRIAEALAEGGVVVLPTDSVYGLCCAATPGNPAHRRIFEIKERPSAQTLPLFIADAEDLERYGEAVPAWAKTLGRVFWPGALTLVVRARGIAPEYVQEPGGTVALRVPGSELVRAVVRRVGPLAQTSANVHGEPAAAEAAALGKRLIELADLVVDGGAAPLAQASTIVDATKAEPHILREAAIARASLEQALGR